MEKKVVVMSGADVAAMRKAHKEAEAAYFEAKVGALEFIAEEMRSTNREYTLHEITGMTGLSSMEVVAQLGNSMYTRASQKAGIGSSEVRTGRKETTRRFVEVSPAGEVIPQSVMEITKVETTYFIPKKKVGR